MTDKRRSSLQPEIRILLDDKEQLSGKKSSVKDGTTSIGTSATNGGTRRNIQLGRNSFKRQETLVKDEERQYEDVPKEKNKGTFRTRMKRIPKSLLLGQCCIAPSSTSLDEAPELNEETQLAVKEASCVSSCNSLNGAIGEDFHVGMKNNLLPFESGSVSGISSCKCIRRGFESDSRKDNLRLIAKSYEQDLQSRHGSYIYNPFELNCSEPRSRSHSRQTFASSRNNTFSRSSSLSEWHIPFEEIMLEDMVAKSMKGPVYRGRWHGEVMVFRSTKSKKEEFLREVSLLNSIRHENVILFMGACIEAPDLAVVTSISKGCSLYTHVHEKNTMFNLSSKLSIITQIAQGMEYLHAKKIELGKLCSRNIFLESKVKIGVTDYINKHNPVVKFCSGYIPDRQILYYSPEQMRCLRIKDQTIHCDKSASMAGDVYAYGTILYEIFLEVYPHVQEHLEVIIWNFSCGRKLNDLEDIPFSVGNELFTVCWKYDPSKRPTFQQILAALRRQEKPRLKRQHSISQPNGMDQFHGN